MFLDNNNAVDRINVDCLLRRGWKNSIATGGLIYLAIARFLLYKGIDLKKNFNLASSI